MMNERARTGRVLWVACCLTLSMALCFGMGTNDAQAAPAITSPAPESTLTGSTETFSWTAGGSIVTEWWLYVGTSPGERDIYNSKSLGTAPSDTVSVLPTNGTTLHVRLWYRVDGTWIGTNFTYTAFRSVRSSGGLSAIPPWDQALPAAERFVLVLGGDAVLDKETGLVWEQSPETTARTWNDARNRCVLRVKGGRQGFRLSVHELASLVDNGASLPPGHPFSNVQSSVYWSATTRAENPTSGWFVRFDGGPMGGTSKSLSNLVWCVRGGEGHGAVY